MINCQGMYGNNDKGGLRIPNVDVMIKNLRLAWISHLPSNKRDLENNPKPLF